MIILKLQVALGLLIAVLATAGAAFADTGAGGGCHSDFYFTTDALGNITQYTLFCKKIDCASACPAPASGPGTGGSTVCYCPNMAGICNAGYRIIEPNQIAVGCVWTCGAPKVCIYGTYDITDADQPFWGQGYRKKFVCWCQ